MSISTSAKLKVEIIDHTALITIDNPGANTWDTDSLPALASLIEILNADKSIFALVITGQGEKFFSAGADLNLFADGDPDQARAMAEFFGKGFECLADFRFGEQMMSKVSRIRVWGGLDLKQPQGPGGSAKEKPSRVWGGSGVGAELRSELRSEPQSERS